MNFFKGDIVEKQTEWKYITVYCPRCGRKVGTHHEKSTMDKYLKCRKCNVEVVFYWKTKKAMVKKMPERNTSSGMIL